MTLEEGGERNTKVFTERKDGPLTCAVVRSLLDEQ
jgi:hypothetical protein